MSAAEEAAKENTRGLKLREERLRSRLADTLEALDLRRREFFDVGHQLKTHSRPLVYAGAGLLVVLGIRAGVKAYRAYDCRQHKNRELWLAAKRLWDHPEKLLR